MKTKLITAVSYTALVLFLAFLSVTLFPGCSSVKHTGCYKTRGLSGYGKNRIEKELRDSRGFTSVLFIQDGKKWGLDYLTDSELDSLKNVLK